VGKYIDMSFCKRRGEVDTMWDSLCFASKVMG